MNYWNDDAPKWATTVIKSKDKKEFYASDWGTKDGDRQQVGSHRKECGEADMSGEHFWTLISTKPKPFNYLTQPWKIRTGSPERSKLVQEFLFAQGIGWEASDATTSKSFYNEKFLTNVFFPNSISKHILYSPNGNIDKVQATEIVLEFETTVKSVQYIPPVAIQLRR